MKNRFFKILSNSLLVMLCNMIMSSTLTLNVSDLDKFQIENNLNSKITSVIRDLLNYQDNQFAVTSNVLILDSRNSGNSVSKTFGALELEGILPSVPQKTQQAGTANIDDYKIQIKDITVWLDYELDMINAQQNIRKSLFDSIDWLNDCENCLKFRTKQFTVSKNAQNSTANINPNSMNPNNLATEDDLRIIEDNIIYLQEQIEKFDENSNNNSAKNQWMTDFLNKELQEQKELNSELSDQLIENAKNIIRRDSSIIMNTTLGQKEIAQTAMQENSRIVEKVSDNQFENNRYMLIVLFVLIGIVVLLVLLSFFNKGPKTVYLRPKSNDKTPSKDEIVSNNQPNTPQNLSSSDQISETTKAYEDESVIQSDLKTIKQSAVKMSVGQKHQASQILKDWLDDGNKEDSGNNEQVEESN
mgnify:CR=1 FL=1|tara:strand:+ start:17362 stop:18606 length:1245 start_codon:yes stop_codon:yes gene_type:complete